MWQEFKLWQQREPPIYILSLPLISCLPSATKSQFSDSNLKIIIFIFQGCGHPLRSCLWGTWYPISTFSVVALIIWYNHPALGKESWSTVGAGSHLSHACPFYALSICDIFQEKFHFNYWGESYKLKKKKRTIPHSVHMIRKGFPAKIHIWLA